MDGTTVRANGHALPALDLRPLPPVPPEPGEPGDEQSAATRLRAAWDGHRGKVLKGIAAAVLLSTAASFYESFSGLVGWFERLGFHGFRAVAAPAMVDLVGLAGEAIALVVIIEGRPGKVVRVLAWGAFSWGLVLSVVGNAGRDGFRGGAAGWFDMAWFAVPPLSLAIITSAALALAKLLLKPPDDGHADGHADGQDDDSEPPPDTADDRQDDGTKPPPKPPRARQPRQSGRARAAAILRQHRDWPDARVAKQAGVSERTVQRARSEL